MTEAAAKPFSIFAILNLTPDSFSDGAPQGGVADFLERARRLIAEGADVLDIGGESTRPDSAPVSLDEEKNRVLPFLQAFRTEFPQFPLSLDTKKYEIALAAMSYGIQYLNDVSFLADPRLAVLAKHSHLNYILMHTRGNHRQMQANSDYPQGLLPTLRSEIHERLRALHDLDFPQQRLWLDPGFGFAKTPEQCVELMEHLEFWQAFDLPLMLGVSRKRFLQKYVGETQPVDRDAISAECAQKAFLSGFRAFRVHNVALTKKTLTAVNKKDYK